MSSETSPPLPAQQEESPRRDSLSVNADQQAENDAIKSVWWTLPALAIGIFLSAADQTIVVASYGKIGSEFKAMNRTSWIATAYVSLSYKMFPFYRSIRWNKKDKGLTTFHSGTFLPRRLFSLSMAA